MAKALLKGNARIEKFTNILTDLRVNQDMEMTSRVTKWMRMKMVLNKLLALLGGSSEFIMSQPKGLFQSKYDPAKRAGTRHDISFEETDMQELEAWLFQYILKRNP